MMKNDSKIMSERDRNLRNDFSSRLKKFNKRVNFYFCGCTNRKSTVGQTVHLCWMIIFVSLARINLSVFQRILSR